MKFPNDFKGLYAICDNTFSPAYSHLELAKQMLEGGANIIQLRMKDEKDLNQVHQVAQSILDLKKKKDFFFILNDYVELASELNIDGLHVGENDCPVDELKSRISEKIFVGYSSHSIEEALIAQKKGADYIALGAIFPTKTKGPNHPVQGLEKLKSFVSSIQVPSVAIGGITLQNVEQILQSKVSCFAVITAITQSSNIQQATREFKQCYENFSL